MKRRTFVKSLAITGAALSGMSFTKFMQDLPPLSPANGGRSILPGALMVGDIIISTTNHLSSAIIRSQTDLPISHARIVYDVTKSDNPDFF